MGVCGPGVKISNQAVPVACHFRIQESDGLQGPLCSKPDGRMERVYFIEKDHQPFFVMWPDG